MDNIILKYTRNSFTEKMYLGQVIAIDKNKNKIFEFNNDNEPIIFRSAQKPFQAFSVLQTNAYKMFGFDDKMLAVCCGSHVGDEKNIEQVKKILKSINLSEKELLCPKAIPLCKKTNKKKKIYNNCSGKHAGMLTVCQAKNFSLENYNMLSHPLQKDIIKNTLAFCEYKKENVAFDGCGVPVLAIPVINMAKGLLNLNEDTLGKKLINSVLKNPDIFGGKNRLDSEIIKISKGKIFAKVGAEGLCILLNTKKEEALVLKIFADDMYARAVLAGKLLYNLEWFNLEEYKKLKQLYPQNIDNNRRIEICLKF